MASFEKLKDHILESVLVNRRLLIAAIMVMFLFAIVVARLFILQVVEHDHFDFLSDRNRVDIQAIPPQRGLIYDRNGVLLAENLPTFNLEMVPEKVPDLEESLARLSKLVRLTPDDIKNLHKELKHHRAFDQVVIRQRLTEEEVAKFSVNRFQFPGIDVVGRLIRHYPQGSLFSHLIGYVGRINEKDLQDINQKNYKGTQEIGKTGVEKQYESTLHGTVGYREVETNVQGRVIRELHTVPAKSGDDLFLNIDIKLQRLASESFGQEKGALVALDPRTGAVLALVSKPDFDPNAFVGGISSKAYSVLRNSKAKPLYNRAIRGSYPPGSTYKPFIGLAGLELGVIKAATKIFCPGWYSLPHDDHRYRDWKHSGHGWVDIDQAITQSCDVYFYGLAHSLGIDRIHQFLSLFDFGQRTGVDLPGEGSGILPSRAWKLKHRKQVWFPGETLITGIGQGFNQATPMQLAHATSILAMRGVVMAPQVVRGFRAPGQKKVDFVTNKPERTLPIRNSKDWSTIVQAMEHVVTARHGTARSVGKGMPFSIAAKTGTAQVFGVAQDATYNAKKLVKKLHDHALFIAFAPADNPSFVLAVVVENGGHGGHTAGPIARRLIQQYFGLKVDAEKK